MRQLAGKSEGQQDLARRLEHKQREHRGRTLVFSTCSRRPRGASSDVVALGAAVKLLCLRRLFNLLGIFDRLRIAKKIVPEGGTSANEYRHKHEREGKGTDFNR